MTHSRIVISWCDNDQMLKLAKERGYTDEGSLLDFVEEYECSKDRGGFESLAKAMAWARKNKARDVWSSPDLFVYEWPDERCLSWQRETVLHKRYLGDGEGWEVIES